MLVNGARIWYFVMFGSRLIEVAKQVAAQTLCLRVGIVGINFFVMLSLAALLGFETFGRLAALWGAALVAGTVLSLGGPVILLRMLTDGRGMRVRDILKIAVLCPGLLALAAFLALSSFWPATSWGAILSAGFFTNALACLASVMRALGSVQFSMALRDAGPQVSLGTAGLLGASADADALLLQAALAMFVLLLLAMLWVWRSDRLATILSPDWRHFQSYALWATSILGAVVSQIDLIVGGAIIPAEQLGVYAVLRRVANLVALPVTVATWVSSPAISAAHGTKTATALSSASADGSRIAMLPGVALFGIGMLALPMLPIILPDFSGDGLRLIFLILLIGALGQVVLASSFTVATLCGLPKLAMAARFLMLITYLLWFQYWGAELTATTNALGYAGALTLGGAALWWAVRHHLGVDTSAAVLWRKRRMRWKTS